MRIRWQNLTQDDSRSTRKRLPKHGRGWLYYGELGRSIGFEWCFKADLGVAVTMEPGEGEVTLRLAPLIAALYLTLPMPRWLRTRLPGRWSSVHHTGRPVWIPERRELSFSVHHGCLWWCLWRDDGVWYPGDWRQASFDPARFILGDRKHSKEILSTEEVRVAMPEDTYHATVTLSEATWRWKRWPWWPLTRRRRTAEVDIPEGIPHPGKGENPWDCGEDATYGVGCSARTVEEAVGKVVETVTRDRRKHGGPGWTPSPTQGPEVATQ